MAVLHIEPSGRTWFITARDSGKANDLETDPRVQLIFSDDSGNFLTLSGRGSLCAERAKIDEIWKEPFKLWFLEGREDTNLVP